MTSKTYNEIPKDLPGIDANPRYTEILKLYQLADRGELVRVSDGYVLKLGTMEVRQYTGSSGYYCNRLEVNVYGTNLTKGNMTAYEVLRVMDSMGV